ncbi:MAG: sodium-dependent bicarbonate transport family permease [Nitrospira sp.]|nr:sodium-dependent bicarbonate transport family permease [Nitrospira sp.]MCP9465493.1 sodium-dependent bicarbonate transport family permease [Nitrospira sp.]
MLEQFLDNFLHNLFKPLLLFFYLGFLVPLLKVPFEFPYAIYKGLTIYLLISIGWHGGEELASLSAADFGRASGFMIVGFITNLIIGIVAYAALRQTNIRQIDAAAVAGYYGSDSAGTFVTCLGVLTASNIAYAAYMPVLLAVMEIPGCLVALALVARMRETGLMDALGNMPGEPGYDPSAKRMDWNGQIDELDELDETKGSRVTTSSPPRSVEISKPNDTVKASGIFSKGVLHEVFLNSGLYLLFGGIVIGFVSGLQGTKVTGTHDQLFVQLFPAILSLFLIEMGMTACKRLQDVRTAGWKFVMFGLIAPNVFAVFGILIAHGYSAFLGYPFEIGTYALFAVLCGSASYIAVPAIQRLAIPEASPTLGLAASLGLTFSYNVTIGIPLYIMIATVISTAIPVQ